jgi:hypothetical protein
MKIVKSLPLLILLFFLSCYPVEVRQEIPKADLKEGRRVEVATKIHLLNGSVILCQNGFLFARDTIWADGETFSSMRTWGIRERWTIPIDIVAGIEYYDRTVSVTRVLGSVMAAATGIFIFKVVFGSCPTVYTEDGNKEELEAECFSYSISRKFEMHDLDRMNHKPLDPRKINLKVKNEALETHYINELRLCYVDHPEGTEIFPTDDQKALLVQNVVAPQSAVNSEQTDVLDRIRRPDDDPYRCDSATASRLFQRGLRDWIDCIVPVRRGASEATVVLRVRNSLFTTTLFYDVMMKSQGVDVFNWLEEVNTSGAYAWQLAQWYKQHSGIEVSVEEDGSFAKKGKIFNSGPIAWRYVAIRIPLNGDQDSIKVRLSFLTDNWQIDWVGLSMDESKEAKLQYADLSLAADNISTSSSDISRRLESDDDEYVVTYPGDWINLSFTLPATQTSKRTLFLASKGFYTEWMRPEWLREGEKAHRVFDISEKDDAMRRTVQLWLANKNAIEKQFFAFKIPLAK